MTSTTYSNESSKGHDRQVARKRISTLPIDEHQEHLLYLLEKNDILIVVGDTGSGKSTRIPQILYESGLYNQHVQRGSSSAANQDHNPSFQQICITQPRKVAAIQLAQRISQNLNSLIGKTVGYTIRFKDVSDNDETMIKFVTEGLLIREMIVDPLLSKYSVIMVDEVHERNLHCDILLGLLRCLMKKRTDLKLIICSATLNIGQIKKFYTYSQDASTRQKNADVLMVHGRRYPIRIYHRDIPVPDYVEATVNTVIDIHEMNRLASGKILAFLTGQDEVELVCTRLREYSRSSSSRLELKKLIVLPLYASLKAEEIERVFEDAGKNVRVCIISTNVAETSLTVDGIAFVVDCGFTKLKQYNHSTGMDSLTKVPISKSSAKQRAGRAGRTREGTVYRLYSEQDYNNLPDDTVPEIQRTSMVEPIMLLMSLGIRNPIAFPLISPMPRESVITALELLHSLGALDDTGQLTRDGELMSQLNMDPKMAKMLIESPKFNCSKEICKISAMLQVKEIFSKPSNVSNSTLWSNEYLTKVCVSEGDLLSYLNILNGFLAADRSKRWAERRYLKHQALLNAVEITIKLESYLKKFKIKLVSSDKLESIQKCITLGLFCNAAYLHPNGDYKSVRGEHTLYIHPTSTFSEIIEQPKMVLFCEMLNTTKPYMRHLMAIDQNWLLEAAPHYYAFATELEMMRLNASCPTTSRLT